MPAPPPPSSVTSEEGVTAPVFQRPPALVQFLDQTEEAIRSRLARLRLIDRIFLLERDWMTRITMLMVILSVLWGAVGGFDIFGFQTQVVAWAQVEAIHLSNQEIYSSVTLHGIRMLFGFAQQLEMALFGLLLVNALGLVPRHKWRLYGAVGLINASILLLQGPVYFVPFNDNFFPAIGWYFLSPLGLDHLSLYVVSPLWYLGWIALCAAVLLWTWWMFDHLLLWWRSRTPAMRRERVPIFLLFVIATLILVVVSYVPLVVSTVWDLGTYFGGWPIDPLINQVIFWMFGHGIVYILFLIPVTGLYLLLPILGRRPLYSYRWAFVAAILFVLLTPVLGIHHLYLTPLPSWSVWLTMVLSFLIIVPSAVTFFSLWMTLKGVPASAWEWNAVSLFALLSFGGSILGGLTGPVVATVPWDVSLHNSMFVLSHFHAITILGIVGGGYALVYAFFPILTGRSWYSWRLAWGHFATTAVGGAGVIVAMDQLGSLGILRRSFLLPVVPSVTDAQLLLFVAMIVLLLGQLLFVANGFLTVTRGPIYSASGLSFDEAVRHAAQATAPRGRRVPVADRPFVRRVPRAARDRTERIWVGAVLVLVVLVLATYAPQVFGTSNAIGGVGSGPTPPGTEFVTMYGVQYYWTVNESGPIHGTFDNVLVARAGQWVHINATTAGATQEIYLPFRSQPVVALQVVPGTPSYAQFQAPSTPGVYTAPDGEYDGPWFGQDVAALVVLPANGTAVPTLAAYLAGGGAGDIYDPPVVPAASTLLVGNPEGVFNASVPGPTLTASVPASGGPVAVRYEIPLSSIGINNYLVNVTSSDPNAQQAYVVAHNMTLPGPFGIYRIDPATGLVPVTGAPLAIGRPVSTGTLTLAPGVYLYGLVRPVSYSYDPDGQANGSTGSQTGFVMGLWGVLWVSG
ncbi:MAG: cbb3-type cytochrome c oxidase subunit I [Thermoplasmata archaeon]